jgi:hypothetical protein
MSISASRHKTVSSAPPFLRPQQLSLERPLAKLNSPHLPRFDNAPLSRICHFIPHRSIKQTTWPTRRHCDRPVPRSKSP